MDQPESGSASTAPHGEARQCDTEAPRLPRADEVVEAPGASYTEQSEHAGNEAMSSVPQDAVTASPPATNPPAADLALGSGNEGGEDDCLEDAFSMWERGEMDADDFSKRVASHFSAKDSIKEDATRCKRFHLKPETGAQSRWVVAAGDEQAFYLARGSFCNSHHDRRHGMQDCAPEMNAPSVNELEAASSTACVSGDVPGRIFPQLDVFAAHECAVELPLQRDVRRKAVASKSHPPGYEVGTCEEVSCLRIPEGVLGDTVDSVLRNGFTGVRRLTLVATNAEGLLGIVGMESLVHLQLKFCGPSVISILPEVLKTLPGLRRLALIGCRKLNEKFFSELHSCGALLEILEIETHDNPSLGLSEPLCEGATKWLAQMPFLSALRLHGKVKAFFENTHHFQTSFGQENAQAQLMCLDISATEMLYSGLTEMDTRTSKASTALLSDSLRHLNSLRYLRLDGIYPNHVAALGTLGLLHVVDIGVHFNVQDLRGFQLFHESSDSPLIPASATDLDEWMAETCDTLRLKSRILFTKQMADIRQGFSRLRCLDIAWDDCRLRKGGQDWGSCALARIICNFGNLEVLRVSPCTRECAASETSPTYNFATLPTFDFLSCLRNSPRLRELHIDTLYLCSTTRATFGIDLPQFGRMLGESLLNLESLSLFSVTHAVGVGWSLRQEERRCIERTACNFLNLHSGSSTDMAEIQQRQVCSESVDVSMENKTINIFADWSTLFRQGGVWPNY